ncbi:FG-GAP repeat domain-containing protein [Nonomuraea typhae]|uniref:FG-GAP repeat domain-containing protein n=1 Tax=Nonomuraea typhae TaxID=2603600 RepID=A0ABW7YPN1_9ACTN
MNAIVRFRQLLCAVFIAMVCAAGLAIPASAAGGPDPLVTKAPEPEGSRLLFNCATYPQNRATLRSETLVRSRTWIDERVPYSQSACHQNQYGDYRTDCSGYLSMIWGLRHSYTTATLDQVSHQIARADLRLGDALNRPGEHVALFIGWADAARTKPIVREQAGPNGAPTVERTWSATYANTYTPIRYDNIVDDSAASGSSLSGDGRAELTTVLPSGEVKAWRNGLGFAPMPWNADAVIATGMSSDNYQMADLDGDGDKEFITVLPNGEVKAWRNGLGFAPMPWDADVIIATGFTKDNVRFADLDGDRKAELITVLPSGEVKAWHNALGFAPMPWNADAIIATGMAKDNYQMADLDGDGKAELMTVLPSGEVKAWHNALGFAPMPWNADVIIATGMTKDNYQVADLDGDRKAELMTVLPSGEVKAWHNALGFAPMPWNADVIIATGMTKDNYQMA